ncbi:histidine kinase [Conexibacter sp. JD483]|uniref:HAMP domain-containing sensor histidine kinase n=1 Tax=unclassified Conexibacter TaxID=2627773 RepID=UPI002718A406|nr:MULTISPECIES: histidine kinase [unclassified Conexibacter]MDO8188637.1 histidine kinase [Conexibacter sp. CPCC 205706]MDO8201527.1 histidine kinase [Conexibacter sp. CPCC 205762]MDR9370746.1 histidine kinase [Conexibacter sp. JD483]
MPRRIRVLPLFWRVFAIDVAVLALVFVLLVFAPVTVSIPIAGAELAVLAGGLAAMLALTFVLLRPALKPLVAVTSTMRRIDPLQPGQRVPVTGVPDVAELAQAFNEMLERLEVERRASGQRALSAQEDERRRVARELHDEVGQIFTAMMLQIETLTARIPAELQPELEELRETARAGATDVRRIAARLRPQLLDDLGLQSALKALVAAFAEQTGLQVERRIAPVELEPAHELVVYRVAQEALTNVARHAGAEQVAVSLRAAGGAVVLEVSDDGRGLPPDAAGSSDGIPGMRERAMLIGAQLTLSPARPRGTTVRLLVPGAAP